MTIRTLTRVSRTDTIVDLALLPANWNDWRVQLDGSRKIPVNSAKFDSTRRAAIDESVFELKDLS